jgi:hypothetical protein
MKKFPTILLIALLTQISTFAQKTSTVDLPMKSRGLTPAVEVMVNGKGPFLFAIDTGAEGRLRVVAIARDEFTLEQIKTARVKFVRDANGKVTAIEVQTPAGSWEKAAKN